MNHSAWKVMGVTFDYTKRRFDINSAIHKLSLLKKGCMHSKSSIQYFGKDLEAMSFAKNYHKWILSEFLPYLGKNVAEVGAGVGNFSKLILRTKVESLVCYEPSSNMFSLLEKNLKREKNVETVNDFFGKDFGRLFDSILYVNVLEHIENDKNELNNARRSLCDDGYLLIFVPAIPRLYSEFDRKVGHFRRYTKMNIVELINLSRFKIVKMRYFDFSGIIPWYIYFTIFKNSINNRSVSLYDQIMVPVIKFFESRIPLPVGKNFIVVAKKKL